jgi:hypothetical protein
MVAGMPPPFSSVRAIVLIPFDFIYPDRLCALTEKNQKVIGKFGTVDLPHVCNHDASDKKVKGK